MEVELLTDHPCTLCNHYVGGCKCTAFPAGIPETLLDEFSWGVDSERVLLTAPTPGDTNDHRLPLDGDNGIQWQANDDDFDIELRTAWWGEDRSKWPVNPHK